MFIASNLQRQGTKTVLLTGNCRGIYVGHTQQTHAHTVPHIIPMHERTHTHTHYVMPHSPPDSVSVKKSVSAPPSGNSSSLKAAVSSVCSVCRRSQTPVTPHLVITNATTRDPPSPNVDATPKYTELMSLLGNFLILRSSSCYDARHIKELQLQKCDTITLWYQDTLTIGYWTVISVGFIRLIPSILLVPSIQPIYLI